MRHNETRKNKHTPSRIVAHLHNVVKNIQEVSAQLCAIICAAFMIQWSELVLIRAKLFIFQK